jgi:hypothetical protein
LIVGQRQRAFDFEDEDMRQEEDRFLIVREKMSLENLERR